VSAGIYLEIQQAVFWVVGQCAVVSRNRDDTAVTTTKVAPLERGADARAGHPYQTDPLPFFGEPVRLLQDPWQKVIHHWE
jgi:hypothetical protein